LTGVIYYIYHSR